MKLVTVYETFSPIDAQLIRSLLDASGIPAHVAHELAALSTEGYSMTTGGIQVQVPEDCRQEAKDIIDHRGPAAV